MLVYARFVPGQTAHTAPHTRELSGAANVMWCVVCLCEKYTRRLREAEFISRLVSKILCICCVDVGDMIMIECFWGGRVLSVQILCSGFLLIRFIRYSLQELKESFNYGLFCPPLNGRAGKFLDEERRLGDYPFNGPVGYLEVSFAGAG